MFSIFETFKKIKIQKLIADEVSWAQLSLN